MIKFSTGLGERLFDARRIRFLVIIISLFAAIALGAIVASGDFGFREFVIFLLAVGTVLVILIPSERMLTLAFGLLVLTLALGWRTIAFSSELVVHPSEVLAWLLFGLMLTRAVLYRETLPWKIPFWIPALLCFALLGALVAVTNAVRPDVIISEFKIFLALIPTYYVVKWFVTSPQRWERIANIGIGIGVYLAFLGMLDFFAPEVAQSLAGEGGASIQIGSVQGFERIMFVLYGTPLAGAVILVLLGFTLRQLFRPRLERRWRVLVFAAFLIQLFGIYITGYRGLYIAVAVLFILFAIVQRRGWLLVLGGLAMLPFLPVEFDYRVLSLVDEQYADTSQVKRLARASDALKLIQESPLFGHGLGSSGYVHSDFLQIGANLGIPALLVLLAGFASILLGLWRLAHGRGWFAEYGAAMFAAIGAMLVPLAGEGMIVFIQVMMPIWFVLMMAMRLIELERLESK
ncbi:MAG: hypothetical protein EYC68_03790 [Chloroflexota bacterium]|nr:MAG: hypothetical protein EYC68_03790 [Chloroflexota bacterium]